MGYIDIHSHILYGLDDGAQTLDESLEMLEIARAAGTTDIVATPHANSQYRFDPDVIDQRITELSSRTPVRIHRGCDFHLEFINIQDAVKHPDKYTINHHGYLLVEMPDSTIFSSSDEIMARLLDAGMMPILTHPERNAQLQRSLDLIAVWVERGCYVQVTAASYTGLFGKRAKACADELMERGLVHFVASDAHDVAHRPPGLQGAFDYVAEKWGEERARPLFEDNPRAVLAGEAVDISLRVMPSRAKARKWYQFWD